ncbi:MAG: hypothetical protein IJ002_02590, partial [Clostridia bacterium]|nr:hypothetical protein [Clostridia bacterium]
MLHFDTIYHFIVSQYCKKSNIKYIFDIKKEISCRKTQQLVDSKLMFSEVAMPIKSVGAISNRPFVKHLRHAFRAITNRPYDGWITATC